MLGGLPHRDGSFEHPKQVIKLKLMDGIVSPICLVGGRFTNEKKMAWMLKGAVSLETVVLSIQGEMLKCILKYYTHCLISVIFKV